MLMLLIISMRVVAGVPDLDVSNHPSDAHSSSLSLLLEHVHDASADGNAPDAHYHCHNCCAHAPMLVSSVPPLALTKAAIDTSVVSARTITSPVSTHFRPPRI
ncbi:MAG TPA: hypothetical protein VL379_01615 [Pseudomonadales bacterium]|nr:hypothetical protein [Pseudomonadales bacterium]